MGGGDRCAVFECKNDRRYPERYVVKEHVNTLRFHSCRDKNFALWERLLQRKVTANTKVCSNHFKYGEPFPVDLHPSVFLKGYDISETLERPPLSSSTCTPRPPLKRLPSPSTPRQPLKRSLSPSACIPRQPLKRSLSPSTCTPRPLLKRSVSPPSCITKQALKRSLLPSTPRTQLKQSLSPSTPKSIKCQPGIFQHRSVSVQVNPCDLSTNALENSSDRQFGPTLPNCVFSTDYVAHLEEELSKFKSTCEDLQSKLSEAKAELERLQACEKARANTFTLSAISHSDKLIKLYTGLPNYNLFQWLLQEITPHAKTLEYFKGKLSVEDKVYQVKNQNKPGSKRSKPFEDELLMTLMKLNLNLREDDLAFRFGVSQSTVSQVMSTLIPFLHRELKAFHEHDKYKRTLQCIMDQCSKYLENFTSDRASKLEKLLARQTSYLNGSVN